MVAIALSVLAAIGLGGTAVSARAAMPPVHPVAIISISLVTGFVVRGVAALIYALPDFQDIPRAVWPWVLTFGVVQFVGGRSMGYLGVSIIGASRTALFICVQVPFAAFLAVAFTGEAMSLLVAVGTVGVIAALLLASGDSLTQGWRTDRRYLLGCLIALGAGLGVGAGSVIGKHTLTVYNSPLTVSVLSTLVAMAIVVPIAGFASVRYPAVRAYDWKSLGLVVTSGLVAAMSLLTQLFAVQRADVVVVAPILATFPLWTLLLSHIFISRLEQITLRLVFGAFLAVAGVIAVALGGQL